MGKLHLGHFSQHLAPEKLEDKRKNPPRKLKKINLAENGVEKATFIVEGLEEEFELSLVSLLKEYQDVFELSLVP